MADQLQEVADRLAVQDTVTRMAVHADRRDWHAFTGIFAGQVSVDYTALIGGAPSSVAGADLVAGWASALGGYQATQHLVANQLVEVDGDAATATATFQATHYLPNPHGGPLWTLGGTYRWELVRDQDGWKISAITMTPQWAEGNQQLTVLAAHHAAATGS
jgi:hypothetical protein